MQGRKRRIELRDAWRGEEFRRSLDQLSEMPQHLPATMRVFVHFLHCDSAVWALSFPSPVRSARHAMDELRRLHPLELHLALPLRISLKNQFDRKPRGAFFSGEYGRATHGKRSP